MEWIMSYKYSRYLARVTRHPWAIMPDKLAAIDELIRLRASGGKLSDEEIAERFGPKKQAAAGLTSRANDGAVGLIPIHGVVAHRADSFEASSGGTSTELIGRQLQRLLDDDSVKSILLDFDTPGGSADGVPEMATKIAKGTAIKPIVAHVNALAASAGYWLASQCSEIVCTPSGMVGSIGVFMLLVDESEALAKEGIVINAISAGDNKLEGRPWQPLSDESKAFYQAQVDDCYRDFVAAVAKGRETTAAEVKKSYGQGRVYDAKLALSIGMIDRIATLDDTLARMVASKPSAGVARRAEAHRSASAVQDDAASEVEIVSAVSAARPIDASSDAAIADEHSAILAALCD
jgi:signal peptide peptidase SppA